MYKSHDEDGIQFAWYKWLVMANIMIGTFMAVLDITIVNVGLPKIMASFGVSIDKIEWVLTAYMLAMAVMLPTSGWMADRFGYKRVYFLGLFLFTLGSFLCGLSTDENMLIAARVLQGFGAGFIQPIGMAIITREFPPHQRGLALGLWAVSAAASVSFGPLIGGYLVDNFSWQLIFDVNVPVGIIGLIATVIIQKEYRNPKIRKFDVVGFVSACIFLPMVLFALSEGNAQTNSQGWSAPYILFCFAVSAIALAVFITNEFVVEEPLINLRLLANRNFGLTNLVMFTFGMAMFGSTFLLPLYLQNSLGYTALQAGAVFLPVGFLQGIVSPFVGIVSDKTNPKIPIIIGIVLLTISFYMNGFLSILTEHQYIMTSLYIRGFAMGILFPPLSAVAMLDIKKEDMGQASGIFNIIRQLGGSFGVAVLATILSSRINYHAQMFGGALQTNTPAFHNYMSSTVFSLVHNAGSRATDAVKQGAALIFSNVGTQAYVQGIDDDFIVAAIITIIGALPVLFLHIKKKEKGKKAEHAAVLE